MFSVNRFSIDDCRKTNSSFLFSKLIKDKFFVNLNIKCVFFLQAPSTNRTHPTGPQRVLMSSSGANSSGNHVPGKHVLQTAPANAKAHLRTAGVTPLSHRDVPSKENKDPRQRSQQQATKRKPNAPR